MVSSKIHIVQIQKTNHSILKEINHTFHNRLIKSQGLSSHAIITNQNHLQLRVRPHNSISASMAPPFIQSPTPSGSGDEKHGNINWEELKFGQVTGDYMYVMKCAKGEKFSQGNVTPFQNIEITPSSGVLNYGQGLFEGLKAYRREDGNVQLFRPEQNAMRMKTGADRICMPSPTVEQFVDAMKQTVVANKHLVPPYGNGTLYLRPLLMGSGHTMGMGPAEEYTFLVYATPCAQHPHLNKGQPLDLLVEDKVHRAVPGGAGCVKSIGNYAPVMQAVIEAKAKGFSDVLFLDAVTGTNIDEVSICNIFIVKGNLISTPAAAGTILPGITRKSIIDIAIELGYQVEERTVPLKDLMDADEAFCTGTAVIITGVGSVTYKDKRVKYRTGLETVAQKLYATLTGIQSGRIEDKKGWTLMLD